MKPLPAAVKGSRNDEEAKDKESGEAVTFFVPIATKSALNLREHWATRARRTKRERNTTWLCALPMRVWTNGLGFKPSGGVVELVRVAPRRLDDDNLRGAMKAIRDEVARLLGIDDGDQRIAWKYAQEKGKPSGVRVVVEARR